MDRYVPEIVIGFVAPSGTDFDRVTGLVAERLQHYGYSCVSIRLSGLLAQRAIESGRLSPADEADHAKRTVALQTEGDLYREHVEKNDALALAAIAEIAQARAAKNGGIDGAALAPVDQLAYLVWSFKTPEELVTLRSIYRSRFFVISVHTPRSERVDKLAMKIAATRHRVGSPTGEDRADAEQIVANDEHEDAGAIANFGQNVRDAYPLADFFVRGDDQPSVERAVDIIFGHPFLTPNRDEYAMFVANAAALRSAELGRQVGAAIASDFGEILATGFNEVPAAGGGQYSAESVPDRREFVMGIDSSDEARQLLAGQIEQSLREAGLLSHPETSTDAIQKALRGTHIRYLTEFGRALHAESSSLLDAARRGVGVHGATMYVTTFPCHQCTRQVIASGLKRLVYIYPYPKSLAARFHGDAIYVDGEGPAGKVPFQPFLGVAPRRYLDAFTMTRRKGDDGRAVVADNVARSPRLDPEEEGGSWEPGTWEAGTYIVREQNALRLAGDLFRAAGGRPTNAEERI